jgi:hypothetical protein
MGFTSYKNKDAFLKSHKDYEKFYDWLEKNKYGNFKLIKDKNYIKFVLTEKGLTFFETINTLYKK